MLRTTADTLVPLLSLLMVIFLGSLFALLNRWE